MKDKCKASPKILLKIKMQLHYFLNEHKVSYNCNIQLWDYSIKASHTGYCII